MSDSTYLPKVYHKQGGDELVIADGGTLTIEAGATISGSGVTVAGVTATAAEINKLAGLTTTKAELTKLASSGAIVASGTQHVHIADIAVDANGTAIAAAVNAILVALEAFKINASV